MNRITLTLSLLVPLFGGVSPSLAAAKKRPNVILVMTDDQGYGDLGCHGNPVLKTPEIDKLHAESVRFTDFHVSPFCTPTRASLMTGNHAGRTGAFRTTGGRSAMKIDEKTIANLFADNGYVTGMTGKWHLGDNAPHRPQDRGFQDVVWHRCGGIGQASDYWGNTYFNDTYERARPGSKVGEWEKFEGYCTDVFFQEGLRFVEENKEEPFFLYLSLNAPHGPYRVAPEWSAPYKKSPEWAPFANFYGMIANIDHNMGILRKRLDEMGLADNTILIFMTDNGTAAGAKMKGLESEATSGYNAGMRGKKSSIFEGGTRVPFFIHWPKGKLTGGKDIETLAAHIDVLPTLAELCDITVPEGYDPDGLSIVPLLQDKADSWSRDHLIIQFHGGAYGRNPLDKPFADTKVLTERWRLTNSSKMELHNIEVDLPQRNDLSAEHPEVVSRLKKLYESFWKSVSPRLVRPANIDLGNPSHNPTELCSQDWFMKTGYPPYAFSQIKKLPRVTAPWLVDVKQAGRYRLTLRQWPEAANKPVLAVRAKVALSGQEKEVDVEPGSTGVVIDLDLPTGLTELWTYLYDDEGKAGGAYFTEVEWLGKGSSASDTEAAQKRLPTVAAPEQKAAPQIAKQPAAEKANAFPGEKRDFRGYDRYDNIKTVSGHFSVICPKDAAPGKPWLWRSLFWDQLKTVNTADLKLVEQGYHIVLAFGNVHGHPRGNANIDAAYDFVTTKHGFSKKCSMASFSRGTLSLFTWASLNPEKVSSIYVDNGVCNVDSWPAGRSVAGSGSVGSGDPKSWEGMKQVYDFTSDQQLLDAKVSPIDKLAPLAKSGVPILMVCGNKDEAVPYEENDVIVEARYKKLGGSIKVIVENKGHTHGMKDPTPILEFIKKNTP